MKPIFNTIAIASLMGLGLVGCGGDKAAETTPTTPAAETQAAPKPATGKKYTVITTGTADPFSMKDEKGILSGIDVDVIRAIGEAEGFEVEFFEEPWQKILPTIEAKQYDIAINGINYSDERNEKYGLSKPYFYNPSALMYKADSQVKPTKLEELSGLTVSVMKDAKQDLEVSAINGAKLDRMPNLYTAYKNMVQGKSQVVAYDMAVMQSLVNKHKDVPVTIVPYEDKSNKNTFNIFIVHKDNQELLQKINSGLDKLQQSGKIDEIRKKYVGE